MRANIVNGKLVPPKSLGDALARRKGLAYEVLRVEGQLNDPMRRPAPTEAALTEKYLSWRGQASRTLRLFQLEARLLDEWIAVRQDDSERLLREAYEVLKVLEVQTDFEPRETALMERLDEFFEHKEAVCQAG